jgi:putative tricarboxylic transport membrane protein
VATVAMIVAACVHPARTSAQGPAVAPAPPAARASAQPVVRDLTIVAPAAPGGGWDQTARVMQQVLRETGLASTIQVNNAPGAAGTIGLARFVTADAGNGNTLLVTGLVMVSGIATNKSPVTLADVTPIARLSGEYEVVVVPRSSPFQTLQQLVAAFKADPRAISWGGGSAGGTDEILVRLLADAAGVPRDGVNYIAYSGGGQALAAVLGAHVSAAVSGLGEFAAQLETGDLRALAISAPERSGGNVPTFREQGLDVVLMNWRGVVAPPGISRAERRALEAMIDRMTRTREWHDALVRNEWTDLAMVGEPFGKFVTDETRRVVPLVVGAGRGGGVDWFEVLILSAFVIAVAVAAVQHFARRTTLDAGQPGFNRPSFLLVIAAIGGQAALLRPAGFVISSAVLFVLVARAFGSRRVVRDVLVGLALATAVFLAFSRGLGVTLPGGPFG